jgi:hypothetical protein
MKIRKPWLRIAGLFLSGLIIVLAGCGTVKTYPSKARELPDTIGTKLSVGDTRQKVHSLLGEPLIVNKSLGLEVYRLSGRDINIDLIIYLPIPLPSPYKVIASALILYDEADQIKEIAVDAMTDDYYDARHAQLQFCSFRISTGGYQFFNNDIACAKPETLTGPPITLNELSNKTGQAGACSVVFLMGECPMEQILIDGSQVADLSPAGAECRLRNPDQHWNKMAETLPPETYNELALMREQRKPKFNWTFIKNNISPGTHRLLVRQTTHVKERDFESAFDCVSGDTVYVELDASKVWHSHWLKPWFELEGELAVSKTPSRKQIERAGGLSPILWHKGEWYDQSTLSGSVRQ